MKKKYYFYFYIIQHISYQCMEQSAEDTLYRAKGQFLEGVVSEKESKRQCFVYGFLYQRFFIFGRAKLQSQFGKFQLGKKQMFCTIIIEGDNCRIYRQSKPFHYWKIESTMIFIPLEPDPQHQPKTSNIVISNFTNSASANSKLYIMSKSTIQQIQYLSTSSQVGSSLLFFEYSIINRQPNSSIQKGSPIVQIYNHQINVLGFHCSEQSVNKSPLIYLEYLHSANYIKLHQKIIESEKEMIKLAKDKAKRQESRVGSYTLFYSQEYQEYSKSIQDQFKHNRLNMKKLIQQRKIETIVIEDRNLLKTKEQKLSEVITKDFSLDFLLQIDKKIKQFQQEQIFSKELQNYFLEIKQNELSVQIGLLLQDNKSFCLKDLIRSPMANIVKLIVQQLSKPQQQRHKIKINPFRLLFQADQKWTDITNQKQFHTQIKWQSSFQSQALYALSVFTKNSLIIHRYQWVQILKKIISKAKEIGLAQKEQIQMLNYVLAQQIKSPQQNFSLIFKYQKVIKKIKEIKDAQRSKQNIKIIWRQIFTKQKYHRQQCSQNSLKKLDLFVNLQGTDDLTKINIQQRWVQDVALIVQFLSTQSLQYIARHCPIQNYQNNQFYIISERCEERKQVGGIYQRSISMDKIKSQKRLFLRCLTHCIMELQRLGILHNDIKFQNFIFVNKKYKIIDFDLAFCVSKTPQNVLPYRYSRMIFQLFIREFKKPNSQDNIFFRHYGKKQIHTQQESKQGVTVGRIKTVELLKDTSNMDDCMNILRQKMYQSHRYQYLSLAKMLQFQGSVADALAKFKSEEFNGENFNSHYTLILDQLDNNKSLLQSAQSTA